MNGCDEATKDDISMERDFVTLTDDEDETDSNYIDAENHAADSNQVIEL